MASGERLIDRSLLASITGNSASALKKTLSACSTATKPSRSAKAAARSGKSVLQPKAPTAFAARRSESTSNTGSARATGSEFRWRSTRSIRSRPSRRREASNSLSDPLRVEFLPQELPADGVDSNADFGRNAHLRMLNESAAEKLLRMARPVGLRRIE